MCTNVHEASDLSGVRAKESLAIPLKISCWRMKLSRSEVLFSDGTSKISFLGLAMSGTIIMVASDVSKAYSFDCPEINHALTEDNLKKIL